MWPALWTTTSRRPFSARIFLIAASTDSCDATSISTQRRSQACSLANAVRLATWGALRLEVSGMRETSRRNAPQVASLTAFAKEHACDLRWVEMDVASQESVEAAIKKILAENGRLDVVVHNAGHMVFGPAEAFTPEQLAELYDINVLTT